MKQKLTAHLTTSQLMSYLVVWHMELDKQYAEIIGHFYYYLIWIHQAISQAH